MMYLSTGYKKKKINKYHLPFQQIFHIFHCHEHRQRHLCFFLTFSRSSSLSLLSIQNLKEPSFFLAIFYYFLIIIINILIF